MDKRFVLAVAALLSARAWAGDLPELQEVVVTASRTPTDLLQSTSFVTVVTQKDIQESGTSDLSGVLAAQSGVVVNDYGPQGQSKSVSIRGSTSSQVLVLVDGIRFNSSFDGQVDLSRIPAADVDHIEIVRGGTSSLWGTGAVGGVINIITKKPDAPSIGLAITNGSYLPHDGYAVAESGASFVPASAASLVDSQNVSLSLSGKLDALGLTAGGSFTRAANAFLWDDTANLGDWRQRANAQDMAQSAYAGLTFPLFGGTLAARGAFTHSLIGVPGSASPGGATSQETQEDTSATGSFAYATSRFFSDALSLDLKGSYRFTTETVQNPLPPFLFSSMHTINSGNIDLTQKLRLSEGVSAVYGGSSSYELVDSTNLAGGNRRLSVAGFVSLPFSPLEPLIITPSIRYDAYSDFPGFLSFQLGAVMALSDTMSLRATVGSAYRVPTLSDLYWTDGFTIRDPDLKPETSYSGDIGWTLQEKAVSIEAAVFARLVYNQIEWVYDTVAFITKVQNITEAFLPGAELHGRVALTDTISILADYAFIYSFLLQYPGFSYQLTDDQRVPWVPVQNGTLAVRYQDAMNTATVEAQYVSDKRYFDLFNSAFASLAGYIVLNAKYSLAATQSMSFSIGLRNILNTLYYTQAGGYPMPPFSIVTGMELKL